MKGVGRDFMIGLTAIVGLIGLGVMLLAFGEFGLTRARGYEIRFNLDTASSLTLNSSVTLNGVSIGRIEAIKTAADPREGVLVTTWIREDVRVPTDVQVGIERDLIGDGSLALTAAPGPLGLESEFITPGGEIKATAASFLDEMADLIDRRLSSVERAASSFQRLSDTYVEVGERIGELIEERSPASVDRGEASANLVSTLARIDASVADAQVWLNDESLRTDVKTSVAKTAEVVDGLASAVESWTTAAESISQRTAMAQEGIDEAVRNFVSTTDVLAQTLLELQYLTTQLTTGDGTVAQLVNNPDLYNSLEDAAIRLERALLEAQLLIEKYRREGIPIQW